MPVLIKSVQAMSSPVQPVGLLHQFGHAVLVPWGFVRAVDQAVVLDAEG
jgi:hypothetical protein